MDEHSPRGQSLANHALEGARLSRRMRWRARMDLVLAGMAATGAVMMGHDVSESVLAGTSALLLAVLWFVWRRSRDLSKVAAHDRWRENAVEGRGLTISQWKTGEKLASWEERRPDTAERY